MRLIPGHCRCSAHISGLWSRRAAQVVERYGSAKEVTLVCADDALLSHLVPEASRRAHAWLVSREVRVLTGHRVVDWGTGADEQHSESRTIG